MRRFVLFLLLSGGIAWAQQPQPIQPDLIINFNFNAAGQVTTPIGGTPSGGDNRFLGADSFTLIYTVSGFTAVSLQFESAPTGATTAGTFVAYSGTTVTGANPLTNATGAAATFSNLVPSPPVSTPWLRMHLLSATGFGQVTGVLYGYRTGYSSGNGGGGGSPCPGTAATPCVVDGPTGTGAAPTTPPIYVAGIDGTNLRGLKTDTSGDPSVVGPTAAGAAPSTNPVYIAGIDGTNVRGIKTDTSGDTINNPLGAATAQADAATNTPTVPEANGAAATFPNYPYLFNGATWDRQIACNNSFIIDDSTMGNVQIIAASGSTKVRICKLTLTAAASVSIQLTQGTGSNCASGTANLSGLYQASLTVAEDFIADNAALVSAASQAVCLNLSAGTRTTGTIFYAQY